MSFPSLPEPSTLAIHLDVVGGIAGDMFVAAMVDALPGLEPLVLDAAAAVRPRGASSPAFSVGTRGGFRARRFGLESAAVADHADAGTTYLELRARIDDAPLSRPARNHALALLNSLAEAEAHVHGIAVDDVHFHELGDWNSLLDIVAAGAIAATLDGACWSASAPPLGSGSVRTAHGELPVPAPASCRLLEGYPWRDDDGGGERVTPTGAAILRHLVPVAACGGRRVAGRMLGTGYGAGTRELAGVPNVLRALVFDRAQPTDSDTVAIVEFDVDDMTGEEIGGAADRLRAVAGVVDVSIGTRTGKKGRLLMDFRILARPETAESVAAACFAETSTLGLRIREERRRILARTEVATTVGSATLGVKVAQRPNGARTAKASHDDVAATPALAARRRARSAAEQDALDAEK